MNAIVPVGVNALVPTSMDEAIRLAKAMSTAKAVPEHLQGDVGSCLMIVEQAMRWRMSPFAVAQCTSSIKGKLMHEGKLIAAAVETMGAISGHFQYSFAGAGDDRTVTVSATRTGEQKPCDVTVRLGDVKTNNEQWKKQPDQQLVYAGSRIWARRWTPAALLGVYAPEEFDRSTDKPKEDFAGTTIEAEPTKGAPIAREQINQDVPLNEQAAAYEAPPMQKLTWAQWADSLEIAIREAKGDNMRLGALLARADVAEIRHLAELGEAAPVKSRILNAIADAERSYLADPPEPPVDDLEIVGGDKLAAG